MVQCSALQMTMEEHTATVPEFGSRSLRVSPFKSSKMGHCLCAQKTDDAQYFYLLYIGMMWGCHWSLYRNQRDAVFYMNCSIPNKTRSQPVFKLFSTTLEWIIQDSAKMDNSLFSFAQNESQGLQPQGLLWTLWWGSRNLNNLHISYVLAVDHLNVLIRKEHEVKK